MTFAVSSRTVHPAWKALESHYQDIRELHLRTLFTDDAKCDERITAEAVGLFLDDSKNHVTDATLKLLVQFAEQSRLRARIAQELEAKAEPKPGHDSSTNNLIRRYRKLKEGSR